MKRYFMWAISLALSVQQVSIFAGETQPVIYSIGVVPQYETARIVRIWQPIVDEIKRTSRIDLVLRTSASIPAFEKEFGAGDFDFAYMNPYHMLVANEKQGYQPVVNDPGNNLYSIIVVRNDSPIRSVHELDGRKVAFPAPNALAALLPRTEFRNKFRIKVEESYVKSHSSVYLNVVMGLTDAGGGVQKTFSQQPADVRSRLRILYKTSEVVSHPVAVHPRVPDDVRKRVAEAFIALGKTPEGRTLLSKASIKKLETVSMQDYAGLRRMGLEESYVD